MKTSLKALLCFLLVLCMTFANACSLMPEEEEDLEPPLVEPEEVSYETTEVVKGHIERDLKGTATLRGYDETSYYFTIDNAAFKAIYVHAGDEVTAGTVLAEVEAGDLDTQIAQMEISMKKQQLELKNLKTQYSEATGTSSRRDLKLQIDLMNLDIQSTQLSYDNLTAQKEETQLIAQQDGIVTFVSGAYDAGDIVPSYKALVTVSDPSKLELYYSSTTAKEASTGMAVTYNYKGTALTGEVIQAPADVAADDDEYKNALLMSVNDLPEELTWGDSLDFTIVVAESDDALIIPRSAISEYSSKYYVDVLDGESKYTVEVNIGIIGSTEVQIVSGLEEGMQVIIG